MYFSRSQSGPAIADLIREHSFIMPWIESALPALHCTTNLQRKRTPASKLAGGGSNGFVKVQAGRTTGHRTDAINGLSAQGPVSAFARGCAEELSAGVGSEFSTVSQLLSSGPFQSLGSQ